MFSSFTIGDGGDYTTIALWQSYRRNNIPADKQVDDELNLLSGTYEAAALLWYWPEDEEVSIKVVIQAHPSALHNGDWDSGACLSGGTQGWKTKFNDLDVTYRDLVLKEAQLTFEQGDNFFGSMRGTGWDMSAIHHGSLTFERCLIYTEGTPHTRMHYMSYVPSSSPSAFGTLDVNYNNCVLEDTIGGVYPNKATISPAYISTYGDHTYNFNGCTMLKQNFVNAHRITNLAPSASLTVNLSGCIEDTSGTGAGATTLIGGHPLNLGYYPGGAGFPSSLSATLTDHITNEASSTKYDWATTKTNVSYAVPLTFDGTVSSNQVGFVDNQEASSFRDYRLVADADNLAVKYMTSGENYSKDVAGVRRAGGVDQRDAGAFQSISDRVIVKTIGSSGCDFATINLWDSTYYDNESILYGDTNVLQFKNEVHDAPSVQITADGDANVKQSIILSGESPHNGNWGEGASFSATPFAGKGWLGKMTLSTYRNNFDVTLKDLSLSSTFSANHGQDYIVDIGENISRSGSEISTFAHDVSVNFENFMYGVQSSGTKPTMVMANIYGTVYSGASILERSTISYNYKNSVVAGVDLSGSVAGLVVIGNHQYGTNTKSYWNIEGCTFYNAFIDNNRFGGSLFNVSATGSLLLTSPDAEFSYWGTITPAPLIYWFVSNDADVNFTDCILSYDTSTVSYPRNLPGSPNDFTDYGTSTNTSFGVDFNLDGTVSSGAVTFVDVFVPTKNFRLVADADNLAVQHVEILDELPGRDITGYRKPRLSDAGAFQSISTSSTVHYVGTSSVTFTPDYASLTLWRSDIYNDPILNGMTRTAVLADEVFDFNSYFGTYVTNGPRRVHHSITLSGVSRQDGNLNTGTVIPITDSIYGNTGQVVYLQSDSPTDFTLNVNDIVVSSTHSTKTNAFYYARAANANFSQYNTNGSFGAYNLPCNFKNCIFISDTSANRIFSPVWHQSNLFRLDPDVDPSVAGRPDIIEVGGVDVSYDNCVFIGAKNSYGRTDLNGTVGMLGIYIPNTTYGTSATLSMSSCTSVNTIFPLWRLPIKDHNFVGSMFYNDHTLPLINGWNSLLTNTNLKESQIPGTQATFGPTWRESISKFEDCIFSHASSYIAFRNGQYDLPIDASSFINCSFGKYFDFDGSARAGRVSFENNYVSSVSASYDFLDNFSGASIAYSLRKLSQSYSGYCIKVRRTSDNSEIDVGFDSNGDLNTSAITNHCGNASGYVSVWYDQTSNSVDATQSTSANQPLIYDGTSLITENGKPALSFHESRDTRLTFDTDLFDGAYIDLVTVLAVDLDGVYGTSHLASEGNGANLYWHTGGRREFMYPADRFQIQGSSEDRFGITMQTERQCILELWSEPTKVRQRINNIQRNQSQNRAPVTIPSGERSYVIGGRPGNTAYNMNGRYQEFIIFPEDQDTSRDAIFDNLNNHYEASPLYFTPRNQ